MLLEYLEQSSAYDKIIRNKCDEQFGYGSFILITSLTFMQRSAGHC